MSWVSENIAQDVADYLFNIKVSLPNRTVLARDIRPDILIDFDALEEQLETTPEMICFWNMLMAEQKAKCATLERQAIIVRSTIADRILKDAKEKNIELRRSDIKDIVEADEDIANIEAQTILEDKKHEKIKAVVESLQCKSRHLQSLAGFKREERRNT